MEKHEMEAKLKAIMEEVDKHYDYGIKSDLEIALKFLQKDGDHDLVSDTIEKNFKVLINIGIDLKALVSLIDSEKIASNKIAENLELLLGSGYNYTTLVSMMNVRYLMFCFKEFVSHKIDIGPVIEKVIAKSSVERFSYELSKSAKTWHLRDRIAYFEILKQYIPTEEVAELLFSKYDRKDCKHSKLWQNKNRDEIAEIAIKENHVSDFINLAFPDFSHNFIEEILPFLKKLVDSGANKKTIIQAILWKGNETIFTKKCMKCLLESGIDLREAPDIIIDFLSTEYHFWFNRIAHESPEFLSEFIESLDKEVQSELFHRIGPDAIENLYFDGEDSFLNFYLTNVPVLDGEIPLLFMKEIPEKLASHERRDEFEKYLRRVVSDDIKEIASSTYQDIWVEEAKKLLKHFE